MTVFFSMPGFDPQNLDTLNQRTTKVAALTPLRCLLFVKFVEKIKKIKKKDVPKMDEGYEL